MAVDYRRPALLCQTSVVYKLLSMLIVSLLVLASTPRVHSQSVSVRLVGSTLPNEGRLEVYYSGVWGTVCVDHFDYIDAGVVCNSLGRGYGYKGTVIGSRYGPGNGTIWMDDVQCVGAETSIAACTHAGWGVHNCDHSEDVSVSCGTSPVRYGPLSNADNFFFVTDTYLRNIYQVDATSGAMGQLLPFGAASNPVALAYDSTAKLLYWTDVQSHTINRYSLLTNSTTVIYRDDIAVFDGLAIDIRRQKLYYADAAETGGKVGELSTDGTAHRVLISVNIKPRAIVFDENNRTLYWTDWGTSPAIYRSSVVSPAQQTLVSGNLVWPNALAINFAAGVMYWGDAKLDKIEMANLDGTGRTLIGTAKNTHFFSFTFHAGNIYITDWTRAHILRLNITALTISSQSSATPFHRLNGIVFVPPGTGTTRSLTTTTTVALPPSTTTTQSTISKSLSVSNETPNQEPNPIPSATMTMTTKKSTTTPAPAATTALSETMIIVITACAVGVTVIIVIVIAVVIIAYRCTRRQSQATSEPDNRPVAPKPSYEQPQPMFSPVYDELDNVDDQTNGMYLHPNFGHVPAFSPYDRLDTAAMKQSDS